jgi:hypothetical protein
MIVVEQLPVAVPLVALEAAFVVERQLLVVQLAAFVPAVAS